METIAKSALEVKILDLCEKHLGAQGFHTVDVDCHVGGRSIVRVFIERMKGEALASQTGTSIEDCAVASRLLAPLLEGGQVLPGPYDLEVSSPGVDRRLRLKSDFESAIGSEIKLKLTESYEGKGANLTGSLLEVGTSSIALKVAGQDRQIPWEKIKRANRVFHFDKG